MSTRDSNLSIHPQVYASNHSTTYTALAVLKYFQPIVHVLTGLSHPYAAWPFDYSTLLQELSDLWPLPNLRAMQSNAEHPSLLSTRMAHRDSIQSVEGVMLLVAQSDYITSIKTFLWSDQPSVQPLYLDFLQDSRPETLEPKRMTKSSDSVLIWIQVGKSIQSLEVAPFHQDCDSQAFAWLVMFAVHVAVFAVPYSAPCGCKGVRRYLALGYWTRSLQWGIEPGASTIQSRSRSLVGASFPSKIHADLVRL
jgi:hypothetical protein